MSSGYHTQNELLLQNLLTFYDDKNLEKMLKIINGESKISLRIVDWFTTNYAKNIILYIVILISLTIVIDLKYIMTINLNLRHILKKDLTLFVDGNALQFHIKINQYRQLLVN